MVQETFTDANGQQKTVVAQTDDELKQAVVDTKNVKAPTYPNINTPVQKGHDLTETQADLSTKLVDGTGSHNSPQNAVNDDGSLNAAGDSLGLKEAPLKEANTGNPVGDPAVAPDETPTEQPAEEPTDTPG